MRAYIFRLRAEIYADDEEQAYQFLGRELKLAAHLISVKESDPVVTVISCEDVGEWSPALGLNP